MAKYRFIDGKLVLVEGTEPSDKPIGAAAVHFFKEGFYEHITDEPVFCDSMAKLKEACDKNGVTSQYERDTGTFRRSSRWV